MKNIEITDEDIFIFSLYPELLDADKVRYITENENLFQQQIALCRDLNNPDSFEVHDIINKKYTSPLQPIVLYPVRIQLPFEHKGLSLAASSAKTDDSKVHTYTDNNSEFILKILSLETGNRFYLYRKDNTPLLTYKLKVQPEDVILEVEKGEVKSELPVISEITSLELLN